MTISELSTDELSRWIAEKMDPGKKADWWHYRAASNDWVPRPYDEPEIAMRLLRHLINTGNNVHFEADATYPAGRLERAIAEAAAFAIEEIS